MKRKQRFQFDDNLLKRTWIFPPDGTDCICEVCKEKLVPKKATYRFKNEKKFVHADCYWGR